MDWNKLLDKFFVFATALIPGSCVLLVTALHRPGLWSEFSGLAFIDYQAKIAILVFAALVAGLTVNEIIVSVATFLVSFGTSYKAARNARGAKTSGLKEEGSQPQAPVTQPQFFPWRKENWRKLLTAYLGSAAPEVVPLVQDPELTNDALWQEWWDLLYTLVTPQLSPKNDQQKAMMVNAGVNFGGASLILLFSSPWTSALRHWWIILPSVFWVLDSAAFYFQQFRNAMDPEYSHFKQMEYLQMRVGKGETETDDPK